LICINNTNYVVDVYGCRKNQPLPNTLLPPICSGSGYQNHYTSISKVCFPGSKPAVIVGSEVLDAVLCTMHPCPGNQWGVSIGIIANDLFCWTIWMPKCWNVTANCVERCGDECCIYAVRYKQNPPCAFDVLVECGDETECDQDCDDGREECPTTMPNCCGGL